MAQNPHQYLAEFLANHLNQVDSIYLIDHRSKINLRDVEMSGLHHIESNQVAQFQSEAINTVIRDYEIYNNYDWIFVLDIDEFLPFTSRGELNEFLEMNANQQLLGFNWINGVGVYPSIDSASEDKAKSLCDVSPLTVSTVKNPNIKVCVNCKRLKYPFYFRTGAHEVVKLRFMGDFLTLRMKYRSIKPYITNKSLYHILAFDKNTFYLKIKNYVNQMDMRKHVLGQGGWMVKEYLRDFDDKAWLNAVQNFRVTDKNLQLTEVDESIFTKINIFKHIPDVAIEEIKKYIRMAKKKVLFDQGKEEIEYLSSKKYDTDIARNIDSFKIGKSFGRSNAEIFIKDIFYQKNKGKLCQWKD